MSFAIDDVDIFLGQVVAIGFIEFFYIFFRCSLQNVPIMFEIPSFEPQSTAITHVICKLSCVPINLFRDTPSVDAGAAQLVHFNDGYSLFVFRRPLCSSKTATACAYNN